VKDYRTYHRLVRRLRELRPDVVHTHSSKAGIIGRWAADRAKVPVIVHTIHGLSFTASTSRMVNSVYKLLERQAAPLTTKIVCVADAMRDASLGASIGRPDQYVTVYSGMETGAFLNPPVPRDEVRARHGIAPGDVVVGTIARLFHLKGHDDLLDEAPRLCGQLPNLKFMWVGDGILREPFVSRMAAMSLRGRFVLTGLVPPSQIPELVGAMDIVVHPSRREGLARAIPQGSLGGKPVITYDIDGNAEAVAEGKTGFVVRPFDRQQLADRIAVLAEDAPRRAAMGEAGRAMALARFDTKVMVDALDRVYTALVAGHARGST
jgi:glycosyltransferase involved in cell wall biosynthesis